jgi:anhydro-N-acetylmuramic acid kinase
LFHRFGRKTVDAPFAEPRNCRSHGITSRYSKVTGDIPPGGARRALGLMSGTSLDGIDAAILDTDGERIVATGAALTVPYGDALRARLRSVLGGDGPVEDVAREVTEAHAAAVAELLRRAGLGTGDVGVIGFHGHTILHRPNQGRTWQIGDGALLARATGIDVVADFRSADIAAGGQGAPLAPLYHAALCGGMAKPVCVLNLGGIANLTWIGDAGIGETENVIAFDTGPGNALLDDWALLHTGRPFDEGGVLAAAGTVDAAVLEALLAHPHFGRPPPKSLDRLDFDCLPPGSLSAADGAATLVAFTCTAVALAVSCLPAPPARWLVTGGGRHNPTLMAGLAHALDEPVDAAEAVGWDGDAIEAQAFAFLAVRSLRGLPLSLPSTTGAAMPVPGGTLHRWRKG